MALDALIPGLVGLLIFGGWGSRLLWLGLVGRRSASWPTVRGTITRGSVHRPPPQPDRGHLRNHVRTEFEYTYEVGGATYTGSRTRFGGALTLERRNAGHAYVAGTKGMEVTVYYHPRRPGLSTLQPRVDVALWGEAVLFLAVGLGVLSGLLTGT